MTIRPVDPADTPELVRLATATAVFKPLELETLVEVLDDYHDHNREHGHCADLAEQDDLAGFSYYAPAAMTDRSWYLYWLAVDPARQGQGVGKELLDRAEAAIRSAGGRLLVIETSGLAHYEPARRFYAKCGYRSDGRVVDFYADGDDMVVFTKHV